MTNKFECTGLWWLPQNPDTKISGTLHFNSVDGASLSLIGSFNDFSQSSKEPFASYEIILGFTIDNEEIVLQSCFATSEDSFFSALGSATIHSKVVFVGTHFIDTKSTLFENMIVC